MFLGRPFSKDELLAALKALNKGKAPGFDEVTAEHILYAGDSLSDILLILYNAVLRTEYVPLCFRTGVQVPLYKGKDTCALDSDNYRGITLLSVYNKVFEILVWHRLEAWCSGNNIVSDLQFACRKQISCLHAALVLRETMAASLRDRGKCYVAFYDVAKAFDTVWIGGLFYQLWPWVFRERPGGSCIGAI